MQRKVDLSSLGTQVISFVFVAVCIHNYDKKTDILKTLRHKTYLGTHLQEYALYVSLIFLHHGASASENKHTEQNMETAYIIINS